MVKTMPSTIDARAISARAPGMPIMAKPVCNFESSKSPANPPRPTVNGQCMPGSMAAAEVATSNSASGKTRKRNHIQLKGLTAISRMPQPSNSTVSNADARPRVRNIKSAPYAPAMPSGLNSVARSLAWLNDGSPGWNPISMMNRVMAKRTSPSPQIRKPLRFSSITRLPGMKAVPRMFD